ncbi:hypothetical protein NL676_021311 [Syzygium grande]|nr:hypothetical protein NL676_021311 [Syzygium grande]
MGVKLVEVQFELVGQWIGAINAPPTTDNGGDGKGMATRIGEGKDGDSCVVGSEERPSALMGGLQRKREGSEGRKVGGVVEDRESRASAVLSTERAEYWRIFNIFILPSHLPPPREVGRLVAIAAAWPTLPPAGR